MEMDIYMRRRLVALGGLVAFFILFVLLVKSCGDDEPSAPVTTVDTGATGTGEAVPLALADYIPRADEICAPANASVGALDPTDTNATRQEARITANELRQLEALQLAEENRQVTQFLKLLGNVVEGLQSKAEALDRGDTVTADEAQVEIDTNEAEARALGERIGFTDCGQFLDAGQSPGEGGGAAAATGTAPPTDTGGVAPTDTGTVAPTDTGTAPPADTGGTAPPADDTGGITP
jgi:hypothetical protein